MRRPSTVCWCCTVVLGAHNARTQAGWFVGICRSCEAWNTRLRYEEKHPGARIYEDGRRKYPVRAS